MMHMPISNIASYRFIELNELAALRDHFVQQCTALALKGTILLSPEGINLNVSGEHADIQSFKQCLQQDTRFQAMSFRESYSASCTFKRLKVKIRKEIITLRHAAIQPEKSRAPSISPQEFKQWLDENRDITVLDTRNDFEVRFGTFKNAVHLQLNGFSEFPHAAQKIQKNKPIVMFCTGGIRCEKAGLELLQQGFTDVYQLEGGILNYFATMGAAHYEGECFVFDRRIAVNAALQETGTVQCAVCRGPQRVAATTHCCSDDIH